LLSQKVNLETGIGSYYLDHLIEEEKKSLGQKKENSKRSKMSKNVKSRK
jgi:hypothetical protein